MTEQVTDLVPEGLGRRGRRLYLEVLAEGTKLGARQRVVLEEAARTADRLEHLDRLLRGEEFVWARVEYAEGHRHLVVDKTLAEERAQRATLARLLSELRQSLAPGEEKPAKTTTPAPQSGGGKLADLTARIAARRGAAPTG